MKKTISFILSLVLVMGAFISVPIIVNASSADYLTFVLNKDGMSYSVSDCSDTATGEIVIPSTYNGLPVTNIGDEAFYRCENITKITIPDSVVSLGTSAFSCCTSLVSVNIPSKVTVLNDGLFAACESLESIDIPASVDNIYIAAFARCTGLTSYNVSPENTAYASVGGVLFNKSKTQLLRYPAGKTAMTYTVPDSVECIYNMAFEECHNITAINLPEGLKYIEAGAFELCTGLKSIIIPDSVIYIDFYAFGLCYNLESIVLPKGITEISYGTFNGCKKLKLIEIPESVTKIDDRAFMYCSSLSSANIPDKVTYIGEYAFTGCNNLKSLKIPETVTSIGYVGVGYSNSDDFGLYKTPGFIVYGVKGSYAETYANQQGLTFIEVCFHEATRWVIDTNATVSAPGSQHKECTECGEVLETAVIPQLKPATPKVATTNEIDGINITWNAVDGAVKYNVYRRQGGSSSWTLVGTTTATTFTDTKVSSGIYYVYSVRAYNNAGQYSDFVTANTQTRKFMAVPKLTGISNATNGLYIKWNAVPGVTNGYRVYRRGAGSTYWTYLGTVKTTYYTDTAVKNKSGEYYRYTVIADGGYHSKFDTTGLYLRRLANPTLNSAVSSKNGITVKWNAVQGTTGYYVYRKTANSGWVRIAAVGGTNNTTYLDKTAKKGVTYTYTVRAVCGYNTSYFNSGISCYDKY